MCSQKRNCKASIPISAFICLRAIDIFSESVHIFSCSRIGRPTLGIHNSLTDECGNWDLGRAIPFLGIFVSNFRYCVFAVYIYLRNQRLSMSKIIFRGTVPTTSLEDYLKVWTPPRRLYDGRRLCGASEKLWRSPVLGPDSFLHHVIPCSPTVLQQQKDQWS